MNNSHGIQMVCVDLKKRSKVTVRNSHGDCIRIYRFNNIQDRFESPYISWANLDCCGGWACDEAYLDTAVQCGAKLYDGTANAPFIYLNAATDAELITTGLLLGYPLESTASILCGY